MILIIIAGGIYSSYPYRRDRESSLSLWVIFLWRGDYREMLHYLEEPKV